MESIESFKDAGLCPEIQEALDAKGFEKPTPIQSEVIPYMLTGNRDIIGLAQTGTGKTAAFGLPILENLEPFSFHVQALIVAPTRELALQVSRELKELKGSKQLTIAEVYGGQSIVAQKRALKNGVDIVVGTPGRIIDHLRSKTLSLSEIEYLVLDEADEMLTGGFVEEIETILESANENRKSLLFSATMPPSIMKLTARYMKDPITIKAKKDTLATNLTEQRYVEVKEFEKISVLSRIIDSEDDFYGLVFCKTKRDVDSVKEGLEKVGYKAGSMHGDLAQSQREKVLAAFRDKRYRVLVVTDVAARGIDISGLSHVINYALPQDPESYVHRIGRTGRAGQEGVAITFVTPNEFRKFKFIQKVAKTPIEKMKIPSVERVLEIKREKLVLSLNEILLNDIDPGYMSMAEKLLSNGSAETTLAGVLQYAFEKELARVKQLANSLKPPKRSSSRNRRQSGYQERRFGRRSRNGSRKRRRPNNQ